MVRGRNKGLLPVVEALEGRIVLSGTGLAGNECPPDLALDAVQMQEVQVGETLTLDLLAAGGTIEDLNEDGSPTGDAITFSLDPDVGTDTPAGASITADGVFEWTPTAVQVGEHQITVIATDEGPPALADVATFSVVVTSDNDPPSFDLQDEVTVEENAGPQSIEDFATNIRPGPADESEQEVKFIVQADEPEFFDEQPAISPEGTLTFTPADGFDGTTTVSVQLVDNAGENGRSEEKTFTVNITPGPNQPPDLADVADRQAAADEQFEFAVMASDPDAGDELTFLLNDAPGTAELEQTSDDTAVIRWTPTEQEVGQSFDFTVSVLDDADPAGVDSESFSVEVLAAGSEIDDETGDDETETGGSFLASLWNDLLDAGRNLLSTLVSELREVTTTIVSTLSDELEEAGDELVDAITGGIEEVADALVSVVDDLDEEIDSRFETALDELVATAQDRIRSGLDRLFS